METEKFEYPSPFRILAISAASITLADILVYMVVKVFHPSPMVDATLDSLLVTGISFPMLFLFMYKPFIRVVSETKRVNVELSRLSAAIKQAVEPVIVTDPKGNIIYVNPAFETVTGYTPDESIGKHLSMLRSGEAEPEYYAAMQKALAEGNSWTGDLMAKKKDGSYYHVHVSAAPVKDDDGKVVNLAIIHLDITGRIQAETDLRVAKEAAEKATKLKDDFVSLVAHDLRSPFNAIMGLMSLILRDKDNAVHPKHREFLEKAMTGSSNLVRMIDDLLDLDMLQSGNIKPKLRYFDLHSLTEEVIRRVALLAEQKGIIIFNKVPAETMVYADRLLISGVVQNLASNAIKFTGKGGKITVFIPHGSKTAIAVQDDGVGIDTMALSRLFKREENVSTRGTSGEKGFGLGLALSQGIMEAHGGTLSVISEKGMGSTFFATLPEVKPRILLVDDDSDTRELLTMQMRALSAEVLEAESAKRALEIIVKHVPNLVIADLDLPGIDGFELIRMIKENPEISSIPIIVITSSLDANSRLKAFRGGVQDFITKPFVAEDILPRIRRFIEYTA